MKSTYSRCSKGRRSILPFMILVGLLGAGIFADAQQNFDAIEVQTQPVQGNISMLVGAGGNVTVQTGPDGVLIVDTQFEPMAPKLLAAIRKLSDKPIRYIINTHVHPDHTGGNAILAQAGQPPADGKTTGQGARIVAHQNVLTVMSAPSTGKQFDFASPKARWPTETYTDTKTIRFNGEEIELVHVERAHSTGDTIVFFHGSNVVSAGDVYAVNRYASYDPQGTIDGMIAGLNRIIEMVAAPDKQGHGGTAIIAGHGRITRQPELVAYRDMSIVIRDRIRDMVNKGMTLEQVKAAKPMKEYEPVYGGNTGVSATDFVLEEIYKDLSQKK